MNKPNFSELYLIRSAYSALKDLLQQSSENSPLADTVRQTMEQLKNAVPETCRSITDSNDDWHSVIVRACTEQDSTLTENQIYLVPVEWTMYSNVRVRASSMEEAVRIVAENDIPLPKNASYLEYSCDIAIDETDDVFHVNGTGRHVSGTTPASEFIVGRNGELLHSEDGKYYYKVTFAVSGSTASLPSESDAVCYLISEENLSSASQAELLDRLSESDAGFAFIKEHKLSYPVLTETDADVVYDEASDSRPVLETGSRYYYEGSSRFSANICDTSRARFFVIAKQPLPENMTTNGIKELLEGHEAFDRHEFGDSEELRLEKSDRRFLDEYEEEDVIIL